MQAEAAVAIAPWKVAFQSVMRQAQKRYYLILVRALAGFSVRRPPMNRFMAFSDYRRSNVRCATLRRKLVQTFVSCVR